MNFYMLDKNFKVVWISFRFAKEFKLFVKILLWLILD